MNSSFRPEMMSPQKQLQSMDGGTEANCCFSTLSECLVLKILTLLPLSDVPTAKCVCRLWNSLVSSPYFCVLWRETAGASPSILLRRINRKRRQGGVPVDDFLVWCPFSRNINPFSVNFPSHLKVAVASGGLVCAYRQPMSWSCPKLIVGNLITQKWEQLPAVRSKSLNFPAVEMAADPASLSYKVILVDAFYPQLERMVVVLYDSSTGCWQRIRPSKARIELSGNCKAIPIRFGKGFLSRKLMTYDVERRLWNVKTFSLPKSDKWIVNWASDAFLYKGEYMLATSLQRADDDDFWTFAVFGFKTESCTWKLRKMTTLDSCYGDGWSAKSYPYFCWKMEGNVVAVSPCALFRRAWLPVVCNLDDLSWHVLPFDFQTNRIFHCECVIIS